jgi:2-isopropylmalate synthase
MTTHWVEIYDTTLRDGAQGEGLAYSVEDKLKIAGCLDGLGVAYIEGDGPAPIQRILSSSSEPGRSSSSAKLAASAVPEANGLAAEDGVVGSAGCRDAIVTIFGKS